MQITHKLNKNYFYKKEALKLWLNPTQNPTDFFQSAKYPTKKLIAKPTKNIRKEKAKGPISKFVISKASSALYTLKKK